MRARLAVTITPDDVGRRVSVRVRYHGPDARAADVVGMLNAWEEGNLTITRRDGQQRVIAERDLLAGRVVPSIVRRGGAGPPPQSA